MASPQVVENRERFTPVQWLICIIAAIGFAFDIYELLMLPLVVRPALMELAEPEPRNTRRSMSGSDYCSGFPPLRAAYSGFWVAI